MTTEKNGRPDLWGGEREWEGQYDPGELLDGWRRACATLEDMAEMTEGDRHEMLYVALMDALKRARVERGHFAEEVTMRLEWNKAHGRLTPFGRVLLPLMERAGLASAAELLYAAGRMEEPHATERLERLMHGPETREGLGGYLDGFSEALRLPGGEEGDRHRTRLSSTLARVMGFGNAEAVAREAEAEYAEGGPASPPVDADGPLARANAALTEAADTLDGVPPADFESPDTYFEAKRKIAEAGSIVASEERRRAGRPGRQ